MSVAELGLALFLNTRFLNAQTYLEVAPRAERLAARLQDATESVALVVRL